MEAKQVEEVEKELSFTLVQMDKAIEELVTAKEEYLAASKFATELQKKFKQKEEEVISMMEESEKRSYIGNGHKITVKYTMQIQTPKHPDDKRDFFNWLREHKGDEVADAYLSVNSQALQSLYNELTEEFASRGEILEISGLGEPTARTSLSITKG